MTTGPGLPPLEPPLRATILPAPDLADKARRALWQVAWLLVRPLPPPLFAPRRAALRLFGASVAPTARPYPSARVFAPWNLVMGERSCLAGGVDCYNVAGVTLEEGVTVSQRSFLCSAGHDVRDPSHPLTAAPIVLARGAWVAAEAFVGPGVRVGEGAVVGARAVVTRSVPPGVIVAGNPARVIGLRELRAG